MWRFYGFTSAVLVLAAALLCGVMIALGRTQPPHPALRGFVEGCDGIPQPCWYGIVPGETTLEQAYKLLISHGYQLVSVTPNRFGLRSVYENPVQRCNGLTIRTTNQALNTVFELWVEDCQALAVADLITMLGLPDGHVFFSGGSQGTAFEDGAVAVGGIYFESPLQRISAFVLWDHRSVQRTPFVGFMSLEQFCARTSGSYPACARP